MRVPAILLVLLLLVLTGCQSRESRLAGSWKARQVAVKPSTNLGDVMKASGLSFFAQNLTLEFNQNGEFKFSQTIGSGTGTYKFEGSDIVLTVNTFVPQRPLHLRFGPGNTLELSNDFNSDPQVIFDKVN